MKWPSRYGRAGQGCALLRFKPTGAQASDSSRPASAHDGYKATPSVIPSSPSISLDHNPTTIHLYSQTKTNLHLRSTNPHTLTNLLLIQAIPQTCIFIRTVFFSIYPCLGFRNTSSSIVYSINDFSLYLMPKRAAPVCPPCQSGTLPSVFEDDEDDEIAHTISVLSKANKLIKKILIRTKLPPRVKSSHSNFFSPSRLRSLTLSSQSSRLATQSLHSSNSD
ncbi:uncharacterized protein PGTG_10465 [Puccinia graminis f. sp. tritici CRL 75-36-700-3]|uniref:Uncharacterized protein n=1 Tax=Puccinia graminis f. sp. tritici (strain CRL 75-36-700-3 / race SCCL) TaxID=418459 RepID=E3KIG2_PUCGT|nr:uncharacterized protein PGTG_10465 [Puccinia graminis f. sp. tritici CRL 75-36-700-3]EFP84087.1 hypothetical protein PGTG_10465 [Puccinia graminis f. sp. tritici CRL 75-36-700-3]